MTVPTSRSRADEMTFHNPSQGVDEVAFHYRPLNAGAAHAPEAPMAPALTPANSSSLLRAYYDEANDRTYTLAVTHGSSKRYLALPESAWQEMLPQLREMHGNNAKKTIIDLSTRWIVGIDDELTSPINTYQIDPKKDVERFNALVSIRQYLIDNKYVQAPTESVDEGYSTCKGARKTFAGVKASAESLEEASLKIQHFSASKEGFTNWTSGGRGDNFNARLSSLFETLAAEKGRLNNDKESLSRDLMIVARNDTQGIQRINQSTNEIREQLAALEHTVEIGWASALLHHPYDHTATEDWRVVLRAAFDAKQIWLEEEISHALEENGGRPLEAKVIQRLEKRATDIASLLIPTTIGTGESKQSGEAILKLFYAGTKTLSDLVRQAPRAEVEGETEGEIQPADPQGGVDVPIFAPVELPQGKGHRYLREMLADFHTRIATTPATAHRDPAFNL